MAVTFPRGLGPVRLALIFIVLLSLVIFRSYYLPTPHGEGQNAIHAPGGGAEWWDGSSSFTPPSEQVDGSGDVAEFNDDYTVSYSSDHDDDTRVPAHDPAEMADFEESLKTTASDSDDPESSSASSTSDFAAQTFEPSIPACRQLAGADKVVVMVKTGASEVFARLPEQLLTLAQCAPNFMVFSDMEQDLGEFHIWDALDEIGKEYKENHEDFKFYREIKEAHANHGDLSKFGSDKGWNLDKWKNIPMLHKAYTEYPDADWFMTIDADTYLSWTNLLLLTTRMDPEEPLYAGCIYWHGPTMFAQGGTGYLLSRKAVEKFESVRSTEQIADWEKETSTACCGDVMLAVAMGHANVPVSGAWPMFQVDPPSALGWNDRYWCVPAITWHHIPPYELDGLYRFEHQWLNETWDLTPEDPGSTPYLYSDVFESFVQPHIAHNKTDWDNYSSDRTYTRPVDGHIQENTDWDQKNDEEKLTMWKSLSKIQKRSTKSVEHCRRACRDDNDCIQFSYHPGTCKLHYTMRLGHATDPELQTTSGWMMEKIEEWKKEHECKEPHWEIDGHQ